MKGKMRAAILYAYNSPLKLEEVDIPQVGPGEALVKVKACRLCHTDLSLIEGNARNLPTHSATKEQAT
jgi:propanol-preferring alcohol dehydrogenase